MYQVETRRLTEQVKRNIERFPNDFMFQLSKMEWKEVVANCDNI
jgi:ORF6N domain.